MTKIREGYKETEMGVIPEYWEVKVLDDVADITRLAGAEYSDLWEVDNKGDIIALRGYNIGNNRLNLNSVDRITSKLSQRLKRSKLFRDDIVFPCVGTIGKAYRILEDNRFHINQNIAKITPNSYIDSEYLTHYLLSSFTTKQIMKYNTSSSQPNVLVGNLRKFNIIMPLFEEQQRIAEILSATDDHIEKLDKIIADYQLLKKGMMKKLLTEGIGHTEYKETEIGRIPKEWEVKHLGDVATIIAGQSPSSDSYNKDGNGIPFYQGKSEFGHMYPETRKWCSAPLKIAVESDVLISVRAPVGDVNICKTKSCIGRGLGIVRESSDVYYLYLFYLLQYSNVRLNKFGQGSTFMAISTSELSDFIVQIPNIEEQKLIAGIIKDVDDRILLLTEARTLNIKLKKALMGELLTGKVRIV